MCTFFQSVNNSRSGRPRVLDLLDFQDTMDLNIIEYNLGAGKEIYKTALTRMQQNSISVCIQFYLSLLKKLRYLATEN